MVITSLKPYLQVQSHSEVLGVRTSADELGRHSSAHDTDLWLRSSCSFHPCLCTSAPSLASCFHCPFPSLPPHPEALRSLVITTTGQSAPLSAPGSRTGRQARPRAEFLLGSVAPTLRWATGTWAYCAFRVYLFSRILTERPTPAPSQNSQLPRSESAANLASFFREEKRSQQSKPFLWSHCDL